MKLEKVYIDFNKQNKEFEEYKTKKAVEIENIRRSLYDKIYKVSNF